MDFELSEEQLILRRTTRRFLNKECPISLVRGIEDDGIDYSLELWSKMAKQGWHGLGFPTEFGGAGGDLLNLAIVFEEMGRGACVHSPLFSTVILGGLTLMDIGSKWQVKKLVPQIARGLLIMSFAYIEPIVRHDALGISMTAVENDGCYLLNGSKLFVPDAHVADRIIVAIRTKETTDPENGISLFMVEKERPGLSTIPLKTIAGDKQCEVLFENVRIDDRDLVGELNTAWAAVERTRNRAATIKCCEMIGGSQQVLEMTLDYVKNRYQFRRPIASFQAVQHHCANMKIDVDGARFITYQAAWRLSQGLPSRKEIATAKAFTSEAYRRICALGHQLHGGISFTMEHDMQLYFRRAKAAELAYGDANFYHSIIAQEIGL